MQHKQGFTLVELAVVLVIIGLLAGGVLAGKNLIRAAQLKTITTEKSTYQKAISTFYDTYMSLPGDMYNAEEMWGTAPNCPGTTTQGTTDGTTCDGDGDGRLEAAPGGGDGNEWFRLWQHLVNAGLISGLFNGVTGPDDTTEHAVPGTNVPEGGIKNSGWLGLWLGASGGDADLFEGNYGHAFYYGAGTSDIPVGSMLSPKELFNIDSKIDDGMPGTGNVLARNHDECTDSAGVPTATGADYLLSEQNEVCAIVFPNAF